MSSFKDLVKRVNAEKKAGVTYNQYQSEEKEEEDKSHSSFKKLVSGVNNGTIKVDSKLNRSQIDDWYSGIKTISQEGYNYLSKEGYKTPNTDIAEKIETYLSQATDVGQFIRANRNSFENYEEAYNNYVNTVNYLRDLQSGVKSSNDYYSKWKTEDEYNAAVQQQKDYDAKSKYDTVAARKELTDMEVDLDAFSEVATAFNSAINGGPGGKLTGAEADKAVEEYYRYVNKYFDPVDVTTGKVDPYAELQKMVHEKRVYLQEAERIQEALKLASVANNEDFDQYNGFTSTAENSRYDKRYEFINGADNGMRKQVLKDFVYLDPEEGYVSNVPEEYTLYERMKDDEIAIYNYYYAKDGKQAADRYLGSLMPTLNYREGEELFSYMEGDHLLELAFQVAVGLDQFESGMKGLANAVTGKDEYVAPSATQIAGGMAREDLGNVDLKWYDFNAGQWKDKKILGNSLGQVLGDSVSTTANMLPSILTSTAINFVAPGVGSAVGTAMLGASAGGNAYQEMINLGYNKEQAGAYATLVGSSETLLQYALGGVSSLGGGGGGIFQSAAGKLLPYVDNAFARTAIKLGGNMLDEGLEEGLQEVLTTWFKNLTLNTDENVNWNDVAYSTLLGALTAGFMEGGQTIDGEVQTYKTGKQMQAKDISAQRLAEIGHTFSADSVAYQLADKVNENTDAYTMGRLFNEIGATITEQNVDEISRELVRTGWDAQVAKANAEAFAQVVEGAQLSDLAIATIEANDSFAKVLKSVLIDSNTTWNQRTQGYNAMLKSLADEVTTPKPTKKKQAQQAQENAPIADTVDTQSEIPSQSHTETESVDVSPAKVAIIADVGKQTVTLEDGSEVNVKDADLSPDDGVHVETIASIDGISTEDANLILNTVRTNPGASAQMSSLGAKEVYKYGFYGLSLDHVAKYSSFGTHLTEPQRQAIYNVGRQARERQINAATPKVATKQRGIYFDQGNGKVVSLKDASKTLLSEKKRSAGVQAAIVLHKLGIGGDIYFFESYRDSKGQLVYKNSKGEEVKAPNGWFSEKDGSIHIDLNAGAKGDGLVLFTLAHELTHFIEKWSPKKYKLLADFLVENYENGRSVDELVRVKQADLTQKRGEKVSYDEAYSEVIADSMEAMLADGNVIEKIMELKAKDSDLVAKIKQFFDNLLAKIRNVYNGLTPDSDEGKAVLEMKDSIEKIQQLFAEALMDASENFQSAEVQKNTTEDGGVVMSIREVVGESGKAYGKGVYLDSNMLTNVPEGQRKATVIGLFRKLGGKKVIAYDQNGVSVEISIAEGKRRYKKTNGKSVPVNNHITSFLNNPIKQEALILADELIAASHFDGQEKAVHAHDWLDDDGKNPWDVWKVFLQEKNNSVWEATLKVANTVDGEKVLYEVHPIEMVEAARKPGTSTTDNKVSHPDPIVKSKSAEALDVEVDAGTESVAPAVLKSERNNPYSYETLIGKPDMVVTTVDGNVPKNRADVVYQAKQNAAKVGKFDSKTGSVSVYVDDVGADVVLATNGLKHSLDRRFAVNAPVLLKAGEILQKSIRINEMTPKKADASESYILIGAARNESGEIYIVRSVINRFSNELASMDVLYAINAKKEPAALLPRLAENSAIRTDSKGNQPRSMRPGFQGPVTDSTISIADLLDLVNQYFPDILPEDVLKHYGYDARPDGDLGSDVLYQDRADESVSNRSLLANALENTVKSDMEKQKLREYREQIEHLDAEEQKLWELNGQIKELSFAKGKRDTKKISALRDEATKTANRINIYDKRLLRLEASKPLQDVLDREKKKAYKRAEEKGKESLEAYKEKATQEQKALVEKWQESRKAAVAKARETAEKREARAKLQKLVLDTTKWLTYPAKTDVKCPDILKKPYSDFLNGIDLSSKRFADGGDPTKSDLRLSNAMDSLSTALDKIMTAQGPAQEIDKVLDTGYLDLPADFVMKLRDMTESIKSMMVEGEYVVNTMSAAEVKQLSQMISTLNNAIKTMSELYANSRFANVEALGTDTMDFIGALGEIDKTSGIKDFVQWDNALPYYAFKRFGKGGESIFEGLMDAQDKLAFLAQDIFNFQEKTWTGKEAKAWSEDTHTITLPNGNDLTLTTADAMSIYCLSRREQGLQHLLGGGTRVLGIQEGSKKAKDSRSLLTIEDIYAINSTLTDRQKQVAEAIQEFMSTVCSEWGNEISMKRFLTKEFTEKFYFPIESNDENLPVKDPAAQQSDLFRLLNISATKPLTPGANNEVIIRNIFDVFTGHASDMARLNAYGMVLLDYMKWLNYREKSSNDDGQITVRGVRKSMQLAYGDAAMGYVLNLVKDVNGRVSDGGDPNILMKWMRAAKTASVGNSLRVATLQVTSYPRAALVLSPKSLALGLSKAPNIKKAKKYCGIALWKSFGFYDTNISRSIEDQMKGVANVKQKLIELSLKGAEWGDAITWGALWNACEYEVAKTTKNKVGSEEFYQEVGKKLRDVVYRTQVVDSTLTRSQIMRSKRGMAQEAAAFMSEPTLSANILMDAGFEFGMEKRRSGSVNTAWKKTGTYIGRSVAVYSIGQLTAALLEALWDAWRDDEDDEFKEKYLDAFAENLALDLVPFNKIPIVSDVFEGALSMFGVGFYSSDKMSSTWLTQAVSAVDAWKDALSGKSSATVYNALYKSVRAISSYVGVSFSGLMREGVALWNNTAGAYDSTLKIRSWGLSKTDLGAQLYDALVEGDDRQANSLKDQFAEEGDAHTAVRSAIKDCYEVGDIDYETAKKHLINFGGMEDDDAYWKVEEWKYELGSGEDFKKYNEFYKAVQTGKELKSIIKEYTDHGVEAKTLASQITSYFKPLYKEMSTAERANIKGYLLNAYSVLGYNRAEKSKDIDAWLKD